MHVHQYIAIQADELEDAFDSVKSELEAQMHNGDYDPNTWYDWFVTGGGRFAEVANAQYDDSYLGGVIEYSKSPEIFRERVTEAISYRLAEFAQYRQQLEKNNVDINAELDNYNGIMDYSFALYPLGKMIDMLNGVWDFNSYFFDITTQSTNPQHMLDKIDKGVTNWFLVPVDFHF